MNICFREKILNVGGVYRVATRGKDDIVVRAVKGTVGWCRGCVLNTPDRPCKNSMLVTTEGVRGFDCIKNNVILQEYHGED